MSKESQSRNKGENFSYEPIKNLSDICSLCTKNIDIVTEERKFFVARDYMKEATILAFCFAEGDKMPKYVEILWPGAQVCQNCFGFIGKLEAHPFLLDGQMEKSLLLDLLTLPTDSLNTMWEIKEQMKSLPHLAKIYAHFAAQTLSNKESKNEELNSPSSSSKISSSSFQTPLSEQEIKTPAPSTSYGSIPLSSDKSLRKFENEKITKLYSPDRNSSFEEFGADRNFETPKKHFEGSFKYLSLLKEKNPSKSGASSLDFSQFEFESPVRNTESKRNTKSPLKRVSSYFGSLEKLAEDVEENINIEPNIPLNLAKPNVEYLLELNDAEFNSEAIAMPTDPNSGLPYTESNEESHAE